MAAEATSAVEGGDLLRHRDFVRRLARELAGPGGADDLEQDAWLAALERPPRMAAAARGWFRVVLRNLAGRKARGEARRLAREERSARSSSVADPAEMAGRLALERRLVQAVESLREPYRSTVFRRYFEDLSPGAIAERDGVPLATVKTRLRRGLALLREAVERDEHGRAWMAALAGGAAPTAAFATKGAVIAGSILAVAAAVVALRTAGSGRGPEAAVPEVAAAPEEERSEVPESEVLVPASVSDVPGGDEPQPPRVEVEAEAEAEVGTSQETTASGDSSSPPGSEDRPPFRLTGRVTFPDGSGVADAKVALGPWSTTTQRDGTFRLELEWETLEGPGGLAGLSGQETVHPNAALVAWIEDWTPAVEPDVGYRCIRAARAEQRSARVDLVLSAPAERITGIVLDHTGAPAVGWRVSLLDGTPAFSGRYRPLSAEDLASGVSGHLETPDGRFEFSGLALKKSYRIRAWKEKTLEEVTSEPIPAGSRDVVVQAPTEAWRPVVDGVVEGLDGTPLADVRCRLSMHEYTVEGGSWSTTGQEVRTDAFGRFEFRDVPPSPIFIRFNGHGSGTSYPLEPDDPGRHLRIRMARSGAFRFDAGSSPHRPDAIRFLDEEGEALRIEIDVAPGSTRGTRELELVDGRAEGRVLESARWVVLVVDGEERTRLPVTIRSGVVTELVD